MICPECRGTGLQYFHAPNPPWGALFRFAVRPCPECVGGMIGPDTKVHTSSRLKS